MANSKKDHKTIMVADDDEDLAFLLASQLQQAGYKVHTCMGGKNLVDEVVKYRPDLLLLDIAMQQVDGSELCREIKKDLRTKYLKILMMSGNHDVAEHASACGADGYIAKPLSLGALKITISKYL